MSGPFKMKGSPMQRNFGVGSPVKQTKKHGVWKNKKYNVQKLWDKYGPNINPYTKTEKHDDPVGTYDSVTTTSPGWGKTKKRKFHKKKK